MILLPSLNRTKLLKTFLDSARATHVTTPGRILVDDEDYKKNQAEYEILVAESMPGGWHIVNTEKAVSMGDKVRHVWKELGDVKWIGLLNDDHFCVTDQWDKKVEALIDGTNMVSTNDGGWNFGTRVVGLTAWSKGLIDACGFPIYPRNLQHLYIDDLWKAIGDSTGCWLETTKVNIAHKHALKGEMEQDDTFKKVYSPTSWEYDSKEFKHFMEQDFKDVCVRVLKLREEHQERAKFG